MASDELSTLRHSVAHLLAAAIVEIYPDAKPAIGPSIENGFYYDFDNLSISEDELAVVEKSMHALVKNWEGFERIEVSAQEARERFAGNEYKLELIEELEKSGEQITLYKSGEFVDLCRGGHVEHPRQELKHFKLLSVAGAYWRGDAKRPMLTRIYGTAYPTNKELGEHLQDLEEAKKRDHKRIGRELDLIYFSELVGPGLPMYTPRGHVVREQIFNYSRELNTKIGYEETTLPNINRAELFKISGHYQKYRDDMFGVHSHFSDEEYFLKPMNCPQHCALYMRRKFSYRDLPVRYSSFSMLYRDEQPGELNGLFRSKSFAQDDGHCFCTQEQLADEFAKVIQVVKEALETYGLADYKIDISLRDPAKMEKYLGDSEVWDKAEDKLRAIAAKSGIESKEAIGEAAIYGPKLDFIAKDSLGRSWQISTVQLDMIMPERFGLKYTTAEGGEKTPLMIHRAIIGSERFMAILIEHFEGAFPVWLSPVQVKILPVSDKFGEYSKGVYAKFAELGIRVELDELSETLGNKIRKAQNEKVPYMVILGEREEVSGKIAVRNRNGEDLGQVDIDEFIVKINELIVRRSLEL